MRPILLDTHVALWSSLGALDAASTKTIDSASRGSALLLSPMSAWEIGMLIRKGRLRVTGSSQEVVRALFSAPGVATATISAEVACAAGMLDDGFHGDPVDRIIVASAIVYGADLMTRDKAILRLATASKKFRCIAC